MICSGEVCGGLRHYQYVRWNNNFNTVENGNNWRKIICNRLVCEKII